MKNFVARLVRNQSGATAIEYGLIAALIAVALMGAAGALGTQSGTTFTAVITDPQNSSAGRTP